MLLYSESLTIEASLRTLSNSCHGIFLHRWYSWNSVYLIPSWKVYIQLLLLTMNGVCIHSLINEINTHLGKQFLWLQQQQYSLQITQLICLVYAPWCTHLSSIWIYRFSSKWKRSGLCLQYPGGVMYSVFNWYHDYYVLSEWQSRTSYLSSQHMRRPTANWTNDHHHVGNFE